MSLDNDESVKTSTPQSRDPLVGTNLGGRFHIEEVLGSGGMSVVYKAKQLAVNRHVAIKTIRMQLDSKPVYRERFDREISSLCSLSHPNIVTVYDCIIGSDGQPYVVMDYLRGRSLETLIKSEGPLPVDRFARISLQVCSAMDHAHKRGIIHRDLKPSNIVLMDDEMDFVKVVDFGLAKLSEDNRKLTQSGELWGSPPYMSPEQCMGESGDERSDIYSLGCVMYEMLTGRDPFWYATTIFELIQRHVNTVPASFAEANPNAAVPYAVESVIFQALEKNPMSRFASAQELQEALVSACANSDHDSGELYLHPSLPSRSGGTPSGESFLPSSSSDNSGRSEKSQQMAWFAGMLQTGVDDFTEEVSAHSGQKEIGVRSDGAATARTPPSKWARPTSDATTVDSASGDSQAISRFPTPAASVRESSSENAAASNAVPRTSDSIEPASGLFGNIQPGESNSGADFLNRGNSVAGVDRADVGRLRQSAGDRSKTWLPIMIIIGVVIGVGCAIVCAAAMPDLFGGGARQKSAKGTTDGGSSWPDESAPAITLPPPGTAKSPDNPGEGDGETASAASTKQTAAVKHASKPGRPKRPAVSSAPVRARPVKTSSPAKPPPSKSGKTSDPWKDLRKLQGQ